MIISFQTNTSENEKGLDPGDEVIEVTTKVTRETEKITTDKPVHLDSENEESDSEIDERPDNDDVTGGRQIRPTSNFGFTLKRGNFSSIRHLTTIPKIRNSFHKATYIKY